MSGSGQQGMGPIPQTFSILVMEGGYGAPELIPVSAHFVQRHEAVVNIKSRLLDSLGHYRPGDLLELLDEVDQAPSVFFRKALNVLEQKRVPYKFEDGFRRSGVSSLRFFYSCLDIRLILPRYATWFRNISAVHGQAGDHLPDGEGEAVERKISVPAVLFRDALELVAERIDLAGPRNQHDH